MEQFEEFKDEFTGILENTVEQMLDDQKDDLIDEFEDMIEDAIIEATQAKQDVNGANDRLYILSQNKKNLAPLFSAEVCNSNSKLPKSAEFPFTINVRSAYFQNAVFGWYKSEEAAKAELKNIYNALRSADKDHYAVYEMN